MSTRALAGLIMLLAILGGGATLHAQDSPVPDWESTLPLTPDVRHGVLDNGLSFYLQHHEQPAERVTMQLVLRVGALQETEAQLGLAHFLEHMMFNGTERFPANELTDFFELNGMRFGADVNASTGHEATTYWLDVDSADAELYDTAWDVLLDWATSATLDPVEVEREVGVIMEEWRLRSQNASGRLNEESFPLIFGADSRYVTRDIIGGDMAVVQSAPTSELRSFYETWYRPELMAIIAVGDIDVDDAEAQLRERFAPLQNAPESLVPAEYSLPVHDDTRVGILTDPEFPATTVQLLRKIDGGHLVTLGDYRDTLRDRLFYNMLNERLQERGRKADAPYLSAGAFGGGVFGGKALHSFSAVSSEDAVLEALNAVLEEFARVREHGFTGGELQDARADLLQFYENALEEREFRTNASIASEYQRHFLTDELSPGIEAELALVRRILPLLTLETLQPLADIPLQEDNRVLLVLAPERALDQLPQEAELRAALAARPEVEAYAEVEAAETLIANPPAPAAILSERTIDTAEYPVTEWTFANGVRLLLMPTDLAESDVLLSGLSPGGSSLLDEENFLGGTFAISAVHQSGVGALTQDQLERYLSGRQVGAALSLSSTHEYLNGDANNDELETLFQLVYLYITEPRLDNDAFESARARRITALENRDLSPTTALSDALNAILAGENDSPRYREPTIAEIEALEAEAAFAAWRSRWAEAGDFQFALVGSFEPEALRELSARYLGNLRTGGETEQWRDLEPPFPESVEEREVYAGLEEQVLTVLAFGGDFAGDEQDAVALRAVGEIVRMRSVETLRELLSGTYSPFARVFVDEIPRPEYTFQAFYYTNPDKYDELLDALFAILDDLRENGPTDEEVEAVRAQQLDALSERREFNRYWLIALLDVMSGAEDDFGHTRRHAARWQALTAADIQRQAQQALDMERYLRVTLFPAALEPAA